MVFTSHERALVLLLQPAILVGPILFLVHVIHHPASSIQALSHSVIMGVLFFIIIVQVIITFVGAFVFLQFLNMLHKLDIFFL